MFFIKLYCHKRQPKTQRKPQINEICKSLLGTYKNKLAIETGYGFHISRSRHKPQVITLLWLTLLIPQSQITWYDFNGNTGQRVIFVGISVSNSEAYYRKSAYHCAGEGSTILSNLDKGNQQHSVLQETKQMLYHQCLFIVINLYKMQYHSTALDKVFIQYQHWKKRIASKNCKNMAFLWKNFGILVEYRFSKKKVSHSKEFPIFGIIVTLESFRNSVGASHWNIFGIFMETYRQSFSIHFGVFLENV